jgi:hypothetical protein
MINEIIKTTYWKIGQYIVEFEQQGNVKAKYGTSLLSNLAKLLRTRVGRGYLDILPKKKTLRVTTLPSIAECKQFRSFLLQR